MRDFDPRGAGRLGCRAWEIPTRRALMTRFTCVPASEKERLEPLHPAKLDLEWW